MSEEDKDNIKSKDETVANIDENQSKGESEPKDIQPTGTPTETQEETQSKVEEKKEHEVIHKKDGRLHIYVRQDKYKGELKSKNWVGRLYIDGKQKISSSGTPNLDDAIPILEKWFDDVHANKGKEEQTPKETIETIETASEKPPTPVEQPTPPVVETLKQTEVVAEIEKKPELATEQVASSNILERT